MFGLILVYATEVTVFIHLYDSIHNVVVSAACSHHTTKDKLGILQQRIVIYLVDGKFEHSLLLLSIENVNGLLVVVVQQIVNFTFGTETAAKDSPHIGIFILDTLDGFLHQLQMMVLCWKTWLVNRASHRLKDTLLRLADNLTF